MKMKWLCLLMTFLLLLGAAGCKPRQNEEQDDTAGLYQEWPQDKLPDHMPPFTDYESFGYAGETANGWEIALTCTQEQLENWRSEAQATGFYQGTFSVFHDDEYVVEIHETYGTDKQNGLIEATFYLTKVKTSPWPAEMEAIPAYTGAGAATAAYSVDTAYIENWAILDVTYYGETEEALNAYLELLEENGFEYREEQELYLRLRDDLADQFTYSWEGEGIVTLTWAIGPAQDLQTED